MSEEKKSITFSDSEVEKTITTIVDDIFGKQQEKGVAHQWGVREHAALIRELAIEFGFPGEEKGMVDAFVKALLFKGVGGNSAQFRQWKHVADKLPKKVDVATDLGY